MPRVLYTSVLFIIFLFQLHSPALADHIIIAADMWCPINCDPSGENPGIMVEIAKQVFSEKNHSVEYKLLPWARAKTAARHGDITGIIGAFIGDAPDFIFPQNEQLMISGSCFFVRKTTNWKYTGVDSLKKMQLGAILEYDYGLAINNYIKQKQNIQLIYGNRPLQRNVQKLLTGRVDVVIEAEAVFWYTATQMGVSDEFKKAGQATFAEKCFIAFSPSNSKSDMYAKILSDGMISLKQTGKLKQILKTYGLEMLLNE